MAQFWDYSAMAQTNGKLTAFPAFIKVAGKRALVVGNGEEALAKCRLLSETEAHIVLVADAPSADLAAFVEKNGIEHIDAAFTSELLDGAVMAFGATGDSAADRALSLRRALPAFLPTPLTSRNTAISTRQPSSPARRWRLPSAQRAPALFWRRACAPASTRCCRPRSVARCGLPRLTAMRSSDSCPRAMPRRQFWRSFFEGSPARLIAEGDMS